MNAMVKPADLSDGEPGKWEMKELKPWHKQLCSMLAQGIDRETIAATFDVTPTYVSMLTKQPLVQAFIREMCQFADLQLTAQFTEGVKVIGEVMKNGSDKERLQAVRLNAELTHRIGAGTGAPSDPSNMEDRLLRLSERLLALQERMQSPIPPPVDGEFNEIPRDTAPEGQVLPRAVEQPLGQPAQENGNGSAD